MRRVLVLGILLLGSATAVRSETPPHGLGLLVGRGGDPATQDTLRKALLDLQPSTRAAAVRVINVSGIGPLVPAVVTALAIEKDPGAASEMVRLLASAHQPELDAAAVEAARRVGGPVPAALADALGRSGPAAAGHGPTLRALGADDQVWRIFSALANDPGPRAPRPKGASPYVRIETASGFPSGYVADTMRAAGCDAKGWQRVLAGEVEYGADGRPRHLGLLQRGASQPCVDASRVLLASTLAPLGTPSRPGETALVLLPDPPEFRACLDEVANLPPVTPLRVGGGRARGIIEEPRRVHDLQPHYSEAARLRKTQGVVIMEANVAPSGCVHHVRMMRGVDPELDLEALRAVSGWVYEPTLIDRKPAPILMTVTVNYRLDAVP